MNRYRWALIVRGFVSFVCGYSFATAMSTGNWWWLLWWLLILIGAVIELALEPNDTEAWP